jgi:hypothetical protein
MATIENDLPYVVVNALFKFGWTQRFQYLDNSNVPVDLTGYVATITLRREGDLGTSNVPALTKSSPSTGCSISDPTNGIVDVEISASEQLGSNLIGVYHFVVYVTSGGSQIPLAVGTINFKANAK